MENGEPLDQIGQLPNISGPARLAQRYYCSRRQEDGGAALMLQAGNNLFQQQREILDPIAQRRHLDWKYIQAEV